MYGASMFSGGGLGDLGLRKAGVKFLAHCEMEPTRARLLRANFAGSDVLEGDAWEHWNAVADHLSHAKKKGHVTLLSATPPCQGMSKNGMGKILSLVRSGERPELDPRNRLILAALRVAEKSRPDWVLFENVPEMARTLIRDDEGGYRLIPDIVKHSLRGYVGGFREVEFADFGIPQRRKRLIGVFTRNASVLRMLASANQLIPSPTHAKNPENGRLPWVSVTESLKGFPALDASSLDSAKSEIPFHSVSVMDSRKLWWIGSIPPGSGKSAFDNQCTSCGFNENPLHGSVKTGGVNRSKKDTPIYCLRCGELLPRPTATGSDGRTRLMSAFSSAYKRMRPDLPAPTITRNFAYACSDQKIHPFEDRPLSAAEAMRIQTLDRYEYDWDGSSMKTLRDVIGESIPPAFMEILGRHIASLSQVTNSCAA